MIDNSKNNLLKTLVNQTEDTPGENTGTLEIINNNAPASSSVLSTVTYNQYTIGILGGSQQIQLVDKNGNVLLQSSIVIQGNNTTIYDIDIDENGNLYAVCQTNNVPVQYLVYLNNITEKIDNSYKLIIDKYYDLSSIDMPLYSMQYVMLKKSPLDSTFLIMFTGATNADKTLKNISAVKYHVNFEGENDYEYKQAVYTYTSIDLMIKPIEIYTEWKSNDVDVQMICNNDTGAYTSINPGPTNIVLVKFNFTNSGFNYTRLLGLNNYTEFTQVIVQKAIFVSSTLLYFACNTKTSDNYTTTIYKYDGTLNQIYQITSGNDSGSSVPNEIKLAYINNQILAGMVVNNTTAGVEKYSYYFLHIIGSNISEFVLGNSTVYRENFIFSNEFDIYYMIVGLYNCKYLYTADAYNGTPYNSDQSITPRNSTLYNYNDSFIFSRRLYNKYIVGNSITSVLQIPYNYLNNEIISKEKLISETNSIIDSEEKEIIKNQYEEVMVSNVDAFKIYDNNVGSTYEQDPTLKLVKNIYNGFDEDYKITNYRINYTDNTYNDYTIGNIDINDNIATINIYVYVEKEIDNIQLYDGEYTIPFVTLTPELEVGKAYKITQMVKVE